MTKRIFHSTLAVAAAVLLANIIIVMGCLYQYYRDIEESQLADELYGVLQEKRLACEVDVEDNLVVYGDPDKLARVFDNILRNAIAYCHENTEIRIEARMKERDVEIVFVNQGDKIPGAMLQTIFEKFYRVDGSRSSGTGGAGLGLAIAKEIVGLHGGRIRAKSDDIRTQFIVELPVKTEKEEGTADEVHTHRRRAFGGKTGRRKRVQRKEGKGDLEQPGKGDRDL